jgi:hypothetical protein
MTGYRWVVQIFFCLCCLNCSLPVIGFAPIAGYIAVAFDTSGLIVNLCAIAPSILYLPFTYLSVNMFMTMKRHDVLRIAAILQIGGAWLRYGAHISGSFWWVLLGSYINQAATPIFLNAVSIMSTVWFDNKQRNLSTSLSSLSYVAGALFCLAITGIITGNLDPTVTT